MNTIQHRIYVDPENNGDTWWDNARKAGWPACFQVVWEKHEAIVSDDDLEEILKWAEGIDGWHNGDERAPHPFGYETII